MQFTNDYNVTGSNRTIKFTGIPDSEVYAMFVVCNYVGISHAAKGAVFDKIVMPTIMRGLRLAALFDAAGIDVDQAEKIVGSLTNADFPDS